AATRGRFGFRVWQRQASLSTAGQKAGKCVRSGFAEATPVACDWCFCHERRPISETVMEAQLPAFHRMTNEQDRARLYELLIEELEDFAIFLIDPEGTIISWNPGVERFFGYR